MAFPSIEKDPQAVLPYGRDWTTWLTEGARGTIEASTWSVDPDDPADPDGLKISGSNFDSGGQTSIFVSGGVPDQAYVLTNHVVTTQGHEDDRSLLVEVVNR